MELTSESVITQRDWMSDRSERVVPLINTVRTDLGALFGTDVDSVTAAQYQNAVDDVFGDGDLAVNVAGLVGILRHLDVEADYPGFVVDELLGRELAGMIAGQQPLRLLGEATFHFADVHVHGGAGAGADDLDAALAAGFQTRLPGWEWTERESPFAIE